MEALVPSRLLSGIQIDRGDRDLSAIKPALVEAFAGAGGTEENAAAIGTWSLGRIQGAARVASCTRIAQLCVR